MTSIIKCGVDSLGHELARIDKSKYKYNLNIEGDTVEIEVEDI